MGDVVERLKNLSIAFNAFACLSQSFSRIQITSFGETRNRKLVLLRSKQKARSVFFSLRRDFLSQKIISLWRHFSSPKVPFWLSGNIPHSKKHPTQQKTTFGGRKLPFEREIIFWENHGFGILFRRWNREEIIFLL